MVPLSRSTRQRFKQHRRRCDKLRPALCWHCRRHWVYAWIDGYGNLTAIGADLVRDRRRKQPPAGSFPNAPRSQTERGSLPTSAGVTPEALIHPGGGNLDTIIADDSEDRVPPHDDQYGETWLYGD